MMIDASRREFLAALGLSVALPASKMLGQAPPDTSARRIDIHGHLTPPIVIETVPAAELGNFAKWTPEKALEEMDKYGVATAMLSVPPHYDPKTVDRVARPSNEFGARLASDHKGRFGNFAFLPMPHVDATLTEMARRSDIRTRLRGTEPAQRCSLHPSHHGQLLRKSSPQCWRWHD